MLENLMSIGRPEAILKIGGKEGTAVFADVHTPDLLEDFEPLGDFKP